MTRVLLTGGSGFIGKHVLDSLLKQGHSVVTTVRSESKAEAIRKSCVGVNKSQLDFAIVPDIAEPNAFDEAVKSDPPFEVVLHTASPFHFNIVDIKKDLLDPAIMGTTGILKSIKKNAPTVKRVVITSSFASIIDPSKGLAAGHTYSEKDWSPVTWEEALKDSGFGYRGSKKLAEKAAWDFMEQEKPNFDLVTLCPPLVIGPIDPNLQSLDSVNTSNQRTRNICQGKMRDEIAETGIYIWIDVRDLAQAHIKAIEVPEAGGNRFFVTQGYFCNKDIVEIVRKNFPKYADKLPSDSVPGGRLPKEIYGIDNSKSIKVLGMKYAPFEPCIVDLVKSLEAAGM